MSPIDPDRGNSFTSFAIPTISGEIRRHLHDCGWAVHVPRSLQERALQVRPGPAPRQRGVPWFATGSATVIKRTGPATVRARLLARRHDRDLLIAENRSWPADCAFALVPEAAVMLALLIGLVAVGHGGRSQ